MEISKVLNIYYVVINTNCTRREKSYVDQNLSECLMICYKKMDTSDSLLRSTINQKYASVGNHTV